MLKVIEKKNSRKRNIFLLHRVEEYENEIDVAIALEKEKKLKELYFLEDILYIHRKNSSVLMFLLY